MLLVYFKFFCFIIYIFYELSEIRTEIKLNYIDSSFAFWRWFFEEKMKTLANQEERRLRITFETLRRQNWSHFSWLKICQLYSDVTESGGYSAGIAQSDDKIFPKIKFSETTSLWCPAIEHCGWHARHALFSYSWHEIIAWCHFGVIWHDRRNNNFINSLIVIN